MATPPHNSPRSRFGPGRNALLRAQLGRGRRTYNLWVHWSPRLRKLLIFRSDVEFDHFCWVEGDETVASYIPEPEPLIVNLNGELHKTQFDARVTLRGGTVQLREIKDSDAHLDPREETQRDSQRAIAIAAGFEYMRITREVLVEHQILIENWRRALAFLSACRYLVLDSKVNALVRRARAAEQRLSLEQLLVGTDACDQPTYTAAVLQAVQSGLLRSDLASHPLSARSAFWPTEWRHV